MYPVDPSNLDPNIHEAFPPYWLGAICTYDDDGYADTCIDNIYYRPDWPVYPPFDYATATNTEIRDYSPTNSLIQIFIDVFIAS